MPKARTFFDPEAALTQILEFQRVWTGSSIRPSQPIRVSAETPREINSGAIFDYVTDPGIKIIQANTITGSEVYFAQRLIHDIGLLVQTQSSWTSLNEIIEVRNEESTALPPDPDVLIRELVSAPPDAKRRLICIAETVRFTQARRDQVLAILWDYIVSTRDSNDSDDLVAVGSAIRKYVAMMDVSKIGQISVLLESGHRADIPLSLQLEVAKMIYRKFEANPPSGLDAQPELAGRLLELVKAYSNPYVVLRDKFASISSQAIEAIISMRSRYSIEAMEIALNLPFTWFSEMIADNIELLRSRWTPRNEEAATWCGEILAQMRRQLQGRKSAIIPAD